MLISMTIDILLLTYNNLPSTKQCIEHLYKHTSDFNLIILDNNSTDGTIDYLKLLSEKHDNVYVNFQKENLGIIKGRNKCFDFNRENSNSEKIIFLDNDQMVQSKWLDSYLEMMKDFEIIGCEPWLMRSHDFYPYKRITDKNENFSYCGAGGMMLNAKLFEELGRFDIDYHMVYFEDPHLCFSAYYQGYKIGYCNSLIEHHHKGALLSSKNRKYFMGNWKTFQKKWEGKKIPIFNNYIDK